MAVSRITSTGQITVPKEIRERLRVGPGDSLEFHFEGDRLEVRPIRRRSISEFRGLFKPDNDSGIPWDEQRQLAWERRARRIQGEKADEVDA